jgi:hypothetical protein
MDAVRKKPTYLCERCGTPHARRNLAVECCSEGETLTPAELEAIGQGRLFDEDSAARIVPEVEPTGQALLF